MGALGYGFKPLVGVVGKPEDTDKRFKYILVNEQVKNSILKSGGLPVGILPLDFQYRPSGNPNSYELGFQEARDIESVVDRVSGVVLQGGLCSNGYEQHIAKFCLENNKPLLGICCGFDNMLRAVGNELVLDESGVHWNYEASRVHDIVIDKSSLLYDILKLSRASVNSIHEAIIRKDFVKGCRVCAVCPDDSTACAVEFGDKRFALGVKFHPELMSGSCFDKIFEAFVLACKKC